MIKVNVYPPAPYVQLRNSHAVQAYQPFKPSSPRHNAWVKSRRSSPEPQTDSPSAAQPTVRGQTVEPTTLACPIQKHNLLEGKTVRYTGIRAWNAAPLIAHLQNHLEFIVRCERCYVYVIDATEFRAYHAECKYPSAREPRGVRLLRGGKGSTSSFIQMLQGYLVHVSYLGYSC